MKYAIYAGLNGGFGGAIFQYVDDFDSENKACVALTTIKSYIQSSVPREKNKFEGD